MIISNLKLIWKGDAPRKVFIAYFLAGLMIYFLGIIVSAAVYPGGFSMFTVYVSYLGGSDNNQPGYLFYNTCVMITGIMLIPHFIYLYKRLRPSVKLLSFAGCFFGLIGFIGFAALGIYHQGGNPLGHQITTYLAFGGFGVAAFFLLWVFLARAIRHNVWPKWWGILALYGIVLFIAGLALYLTSVEPPVGGAIDPGFYGDKFTEWLFTGAVMAWLTGSVLLPTDPPTEK